MAKRHNVKRTWDNKKKLYLMANKSKISKRLLCYKYCKSDGINLNIPTGGRLTSWLFTSVVKELKLGIQLVVVGGGGGGGGGELEISGPGNLTKTGL